MFQCLLSIYVELTYTPFDNISTVFWTIVEVMLIVILAMQKTTQQQKQDQLKSNKKSQALRMDKQEVKE